MNEQQMDDKDLKIAFQQNEMARLQDVAMNLQVELEKLARENKELKESQPE
ncbi:hypothetical protein [Staphylococcus xylosus]|uniref:hypothetical protein n=1 Tax=Staphylococcus xylosus TaxID=1288 RepID=UPI000A869DBA|nr:hypothetical protein [Staphylococcus xylosus]